MFLLLHAADVLISFGLVVLFLVVVFWLLKLSLGGQKVGKHKRRAMGGLNRSQRRMEQARRRQKRKM